MTDGVAGPGPPAPDVGAAPAPLSPGGAAAPGPPTPGPAVSPAPGFGSGAAPPEASAARRLHWQCHARRSAARLEQVRDESAVRMPETLPLVAYRCQLVTIRYPRLA